MLTSGMSPALRFVMMLTTMAVAVPTGIKIFNWLKTMHGGSLVYRTHTPVSYTHLTLPTTPYV